MVTKFNTNYSPSSSKEDRFVTPAGGPAKVNPKAKIYSLEEIHKRCLWQHTMREANFVEETRESDSTLLDDMGHLIDDRLEQELDFIEKVKKQNIDMEGKKPVEPKGSEASPPITPTD